MKELVRKLYLVAGKQSPHITKMLVFECLKGIFDSWSLGAILYLLMEICNNIFEQIPITMLNIYLLTAIIFISVLGKVICAYFAERHKYIAAYSLGAENRMLIGDRLKRVHMGYFSQTRLGDVSSTVSTAISDLETIGFTIIEGLLVGIIQTVVMVLFILPFDLLTGIIVLATLLFGIMLNHLVQRKADSLTSVLLKLKQNLSADTLEYVKGISVLKAFNQNQTKVSELEESISETRKGYLNVEKTVAPVQFCYLAIFKIGSFVIIAASLLRFLNGELSIVKAMMLIVASFIVFSGIEMSGSMQNIKGVAVQNLNAVLEMKQLPVIEEGDKTEIAVPEVQFKDISFSYGQRQIFSGLNLTIPSKKTTAVIGFSGSGKTTLCNLAARFWDVDAGEVLVDGTNVKDYNYDAFLANFSFVFQDVYLFDDSIGNNIKFGYPDATDEEMIEAAKKARCHDFIMELPDGYDTILQEGGSNLSGGERQRISIARAMLKPSQIVILDEATSSIDPENEQQLLSALNNLLQNKTTIVIAHKLKTIKNADQIVVLGRHGIESIGRHEQLLTSSPIYRKFVLEREASAKWSLNH